MRSSPPSDGVRDGVQGERPGRRAEGVAPQHGVQPERPLPAALLRHAEGAGVQGIGSRTVLSLFLQFLPGFMTGFLRSWKTWKSPGKLKHVFVFETFYSFNQTIVSHSFVSRTVIL